jgi:hypothetical protein
MALAQLFLHLPENDFFFRAPPEPPLPVEDFHRARCAGLAPAQRRACGKTSTSNASSISSILSDCITAFDLAGYLILLKYSTLIPGLYRTSNLQSLAAAGDRLVAEK